MCRVYNKLTNQTVYYFSTREIAQGYINTSRNPKELDIEECDVWY